MHLRVGIKVRSGLEVPFSLLRPKARWGLYMHSYTLDHLLLLFRRSLDTTMKRIGQPY